MSEHKAESWRVEFDNHQVHDRFDAVIWTADNQVVARVPQADPVWSDEANALVASHAQLIAAAPDMLAVLEGLAKFIQVAEIRFGSQEQQDSCEPLLDRALVAVERAKGGAS